MTLLAALPLLVAKLMFPGVATLVFLILLIVALVLKARPVMLVSGLGLLGGLIGTALAAIDTFRSPWPGVFLAIGFAVLGLLILGTIWLITHLRARSLEKRLLHGTGGASDKDLERMRTDMGEALDLLRRAGRGRNAIYTLPWYLVVGRSQAGKTVAIKNSGLNLPVRKDWVKGVGGTHTCDWFFTDSLIFLDTPGKWVTEGSEIVEQKQWGELLKLLRKNRGQRPLDGMVVVIPTEDLLGKPEAQIKGHAERVRELVDLAHQELGFRLPVYVLVSKCDLVEGFVDFFRGLSQERRREIFGFSNSRLTSDDPASLVRAGMSRVLKNLTDCRIDMLAKVASRRQARRLFFFPEEFRRLEDPLAAFAEILFRSDRYREAPLFRGFYFSSGTQGEGTPLGKAMAELGRMLGVSPAAIAGPRDDEPKRSYFLLDLFQKLLPGDQALVTRTAHGGGQRKTQLLLAFAPAAAALVLLVFATLSFSLNRSLFSEVAEQGPQVVRNLRGIPAPPKGPQIQQALTLTAQLQKFHDKLAGFSPWRGFGMRKTGALDATVTAQYKQFFESHAFGPTVASAKALTQDSRRSCGERLDALHAMAQLFLNKRNWMGGEAPGFDVIWQIPPDQAQALKKELGSQLRDYMDITGQTAVPRLGFSMSAAAQSIAKDCGGKRGGNPLDSYIAFQNDCRSRATPAELRECYSRLLEVLRSTSGDGKSALDRFESLKGDLDELAQSDSDARVAKDALGAVRAQEVQSGECLERFGKDIAPAIRNYAVQDDLLKECQDAVNAVRDPMQKQTTRDQTLSSQKGKLQGQEDDLKNKIKIFNDACRNSQLEAGPVVRIAEGYRKTACLDLGSQLGDLNTQFGEGLKGRFPFAAGPDARPADLAPLVALIGGKSGWVPQFLEATGGKGIPPTQLRWLNEAAALGELLFERGSDEPRPAQLMLTLGEPAFEPKDAGEKLRIIEVQLRLGEQQEIIWKEGDPKARKATIDLFGRNASETASLKVLFAEKKGALGRMMSKDDFRQAQAVELASERGNWAPLRLIGTGLGGDRDRGEAKFSADFPFDKGKKKVKGTIRFSVDADGLGRLLTLLHRGFPPPPAQ